MVLNKKDGVDIPTDEGINDFDNTPYFDYHHLKAIENVSGRFQLSARSIAHSLFV